jgi:methyl-accepting chemotaxis protein
MVQRLLANLSIGGRINLGFGIVLAMLLVVAGAGILGANNARLLFRDFDATSDATRAILRAERNIIDLSRHILLYLNQDSQPSLDAARDLVKTLPEVLAEADANADADEQRMLGEMRNLVQDFGAAVEDVVAAKAGYIAIFGKDVVPASTLINKSLPPLIQQASAAGDYQTAFLALRISDTMNAIGSAAYQYLYRPKPELLARVHQLSDEIGSQSEQLAARLRGSPQQELGDKLTAATKTYSAGLAQVMASIGRISTEMQARMAQNATGAIERAVSMAATRSTELDQNQAAMNASLTATLAVIAVIAPIALLLALAIAFLIGRSIRNPVVALTETMGTLATGNYNVVVDGLDRQDEIGRMAKAVQVFKQNGEENERLRQQVEVERQQRERDRGDQEAELDRSVGLVVAAAAAGDLSRRIDTHNLAGVMRKLGEGINSLLGSVGTAIGEVSRVLSSMAGGDLSQRVDGDYEGVFRKLKDDVNATGEKLAITLGGIAQSAAAVNEASAEISTGSQDLAQRTESQAASIEETAASMHEITTTVKQNADNAQAANQLAMAARDTAERGGSIVADAVGAVNRIEESARKIGDIVSLIDEIAFQTNLLALNASVEAARAGEAGKGFAVVAQEVRALAQRSADASKEIKTLIAESNAQVKTGAGLVNQTGQSLTEIVTAIKKVSDIVAEIAAASREQATGLDQINTAVGAMDETTQRNGALVEQTSASAQALAAQARELSSLVAFFRTGQA